MKIPLIACLLPLACSAALAQEAVFRDVNLPVEKRVDNLVSQLTVPEKISQLMMASPAIGRLHIPAYHWWSEALHGVAIDGVATVFPQAIGLAATWDTDLHYRIADAISTEKRAKNNEAFRLSKGGDSAIFQGLTIWSPNINLLRDPRWGRAQETYGEDPYLTGRFAVAFVEGLQGHDPTYLKTVATPKHFAVHSGPEPERHRFDARPPERDFYESYLPAFEASVREGHAWSLMCAYSALFGVPDPASKLLLTDTLRTRWGFQGAVVSDLDAVADIWGMNAHRYAADAAAASALALKAGTDLNVGTTYMALGDSLRRGLITEADLDRAAKRVFLLRFKLGLFDPHDRISYSAIPLSEVNSPAHNQLALEASRESIVLLKNDGTLPWDIHSMHRVAVIGPTADRLSAMLGSYNGQPEKYVSLLDGLRAKLEPKGVQVNYERGAALTPGHHDGYLPYAGEGAFTDDTKTQPGWLLESFGNSNFQGAPISRQISRQFGLKWNHFVRMPGILPELGSLRWTGILVPPVTGEYQMGAYVSGTARLVINDTVVFNQPATAVEQSVRGRVQLTAGQPVRVVFEYSQTAGEGNCQLEWILPGANTPMERALAAARDADHILLTLGNTPDLENEEKPVHEQGFSGGDRTSIMLPKSQADLMDAVAALGKPFTVVFTCGAAISFDASKPNAALDVWYYGEHGAEALADTLVGDSNPAGRLPYTIYQSDRDLPDFRDYSMANRTYRYFKGKPLFAFGHGLSYSAFAYKSLALSASLAQPSDTVTAKVEVQNTSARAGDEVVEIYAHAVAPPVEMPIQQLAGFQRVHFEPGESKIVEIPIRVGTLRRWDSAAKRYTVDMGAYEIRAGPSSDQPLLKANLQVANY
jgi:beta-glucosidase